jgi:hypothetical protein
MIIGWIKDIYVKHGYVAALVTIAVLASIAVGVAIGTGTSFADIIRWISAL